LKKIFSQTAQVHSDRAHRLCKLSAPEYNPS